MTNKNSTPYIVAIDWGTSSFRARTISESGKVLATVSTNEGIRNVDGEFKAVLQKHLSQLEGYSQGMPIIMSGMIGSRNGWHEAPYTQLPCSSNSLASKMQPLKIEGIDNLFVVPGVFKTGEQSDVIRGEETEIVGAIEALNLTHASMIIPGTHSKVVSIEDGLVVDFKTFLTGEMFYALCESTILGAFGNKVDPNSEWFYEGVTKGASSKHAGDLLSLLFCARSRVLVDNMPEEQSASYMSGLLLGSEIGASQYKTQDIWIMGNGKLPTAYQSALEHLGFNSHIVPDNTVIFGTLSVFNDYKKEQL